MFRFSLLASVGLVSVATFAHAQSITGGGSTLVANTSVLEYGKFNPGSVAKPPPGPQPPPGPRPATFSTYWAAGSGIGQFAFLTDDLSCDIDAVTGQNGGKCTGQRGAPGNTVSYAASDAVLTKRQVATWATSSFGQSAAGNLIQLPSMGVGVAIPVQNANIGANGALTLSDGDICGVFSGRITDFSQITDSQTQPAAGRIAVFYRADAAGTSFWLTNHLAAVCNTGNSNIHFTPTSSFGSLFKPGVPDNFIGTTGDSSGPSIMAGCDGTVLSALGYTSPDYTTIAPQSAATLDCSINGSNKSPLLVAAVTVAGAPVLPTVPAIAAGLSHGAIGRHLKPPSNPSAAANPMNWIASVQTVKTGYPIVGFTTYDFAQCYTDPNIAAALIEFLNLHYSDPGYATIENDNGFATLSQAAPTFFNDIEANMLADTNSWRTDLGDPGVCASKQGR